MEGPVGPARFTRSGSTSNPEIAAWKIALEHGVSVLSREGVTGKRI